MRFTAQFNVAGQPALNVPVGRHETLPIGLQLVGLSQRRETDLFKLAEELQV
jgi:Asp-tRNA(Asn)/Glu-tRNA(Gln) amidotransferase A subunit family amidase